MHIENSWEDFKKYWNATAPLDNSTVQVEKILKEHPFFLQALSLSKFGFCVIDIKKMQYLHVSSNAYEITGWPNDEYMKGGVQFAFSALMPESQHGMIRFSQLINEYFKKLPNHDKINYRCYWDYQINSPTGVKTLLQQDYVLNYDDEGHITILLAICMDIRNYKSDKCLHLRLTNGIENLVYEFGLANNVLTELEPLSKRELEIAQLINKSNDSTSIAKSLNISLHTVNTHRRNMLDKLHVRDSLEMSNLLKVLGFL